MTTRVIVGTVVGIVALAGVSICGLVGSLTSVEMVDKVNEMLPKGEQFAPLGWYFSKYQRLNREYKRLYPDGRLLLRVRVLTALMFACLLICALSFGFFARWATNESAGQNDNTEVKSGLPLLRPERQWQSVFNQTK
jgi:hypothetical protein